MCDCMRPRSQLLRPRLTRLPRTTARRRLGNLISQQRITMRATLSKPVLCSI